MSKRWQRFKEYLGPYDYRPGFIYLTILVFNLSNLRTYTFEYDYGIERIKFFFTGLLVYAIMGLPLFFLLKISRAIWGGRRKSLKIYLLEVLAASLVTLLAQVGGKRFLLPHVDTVDFLRTGVFMGELITRFVFAIIFVAITHNGLKVLSQKLDSASALNNQLKERYVLLIESDEEIRSHAAQLLHDRIQSKLMLAGARLTRVAGVLSEEGRLGIQPVIQEIEGIRSIDVREVSQLLSPNLAGEGLIGSVENLCREYESEILFTIDITENVEAIDEELRLGIYRIIEQGVINAITHGPAKNVTITVRERTQRALYVEIKDDGPGSKNLGSGKGTVIIDSWVSKLGGRKEIESTPGKGFTLRILIP
ncbi:COG4585 Signal transduction histidine kinase [Candidatus Nanopelagicaceae bacterium]